jgi:endonuclease III-like uncharacterized protein
MEKTKMNVTVEVTVIEDEQFLFNIIAHESMDHESILSILAGGVALTIRGQETPKKQAKALKDVIGYLESEFINVDSFNDVKVNKPRNISE